MRYGMIVWLSVWVPLVLGTGCSHTTPEATDIRVDMTLNPSPPLVGNADVSLKLVDTNAFPVKGATVQVEGNMNHAGMKPSFADLREVEPGRYLGTLEFTMGGDWFILVTAKTPDGKMVARKIDVLGVKSR
jgi:hypothetical protein